MIYTLMLYTKGQWSIFSFILPQLSQYFYGQIYFLTDTKDVNTFILEKERARRGQYMLSFNLHTQNLLRMRLMQQHSDIILKYTT